MGSIILYAPNVGTGGGLVLLRELLGARWSGRDVVAIVDRRGMSELGAWHDRDHVHWAIPNLAGRLKAERLLSRVARSDDIVLCFHNLPPVLPTRGTILCYVQNAHLVGLIPTSHLGGRVRLRIAVERFIARRFRHRVDRYLVQTPTMAAALRAWRGADAPPIDVVPFVAADLARMSPASSPVGHEPGTAPQWDFLYVSDGSVHKNHRRLFAAWRLLAARGSYPSLAVTLHPHRDAALREEVRALAAEGVRIYDLGQLPHAAVLAAYRRAGALMFPSYAESLGVPLVEAQAAGLPILAPELDYVRDVCEPAVTFDPFSPRSIARAVTRFAGAPVKRVRFMTPDEFAATLPRLAGNS